MYTEDIKDVSVTLERLNTLLKMKNSLESYSSCSLGIRGRLDTEDWADVSTEMENAMKKLIEKEMIKELEQLQGIYLPKLLESSDKLLKNLIDKK